MAVRQYIGARYVPKFFDWNGSPEWRSGVEYEALTIVTRNGNSYTSKIRVPSNIGAPESNPTYWVATGLYNEQIESIRQGLVSAQGDIDSLDDRMGTAEGDIDALETRMGTAEGDIDALQAQQNIDNSERIIVIGDSYGVDSATGGSSWFSKLRDTYGPNMIGECRGGYGFYSDISSVQNNFLGILQSLNVSDKETIKRIYVFGGANDANVIFGSPSHLPYIGQRINEFCSYCRTNFPNATVYIGFIGWYYDSTRWSVYYAVRNAYKLTCASIKNCVYVSGLDYPMHIYTCINKTDLIHPTANGSTLLFNLISNAVQSGSANQTFNLVAPFAPTYGDIASSNDLACKVSYHGGICVLTGAGNWNGYYFRVNLTSDGQVGYLHKFKLFNINDWMPFGGSAYNGRLNNTQLSGFISRSDNTFEIFSGTLVLEHDGVYVVCANVNAGNSRLLVLCPFSMTITLDEM